MEKKKKIIIAAIISILIFLLYMLLKVAAAGFLVGALLLGFLFYLLFFRAGQNRQMTVTVSVIFLILLILTGVLFRTEAEKKAVVTDDKKTVEQNEKKEDVKNVAGIELPPLADWEIVGRTEMVLYNYRKKDLSTVTVLGLQSMNEDFYKKDKIGQEDITVTQVARINDFERIKIGQWDAVKIQGDDTLGAGNFVYIYFINLPGDNDATVLVYGMDLAQADARAAEWEAILEGLQLVY